MTKVDCSCSLPFTLRTSPFTRSTMGPRRGVPLVFASILLLASPAQAQSTNCHPGVPEVDRVSFSGNRSIPTRSLVGRDRDEAIIRRAPPDEVLRRSTLPAAGRAPARYRQAHALLSARRLPTCRCGYGRRSPGSCARPRPVLGPGERANTRRLDCAAGRERLGTARPTRPGHHGEHRTSARPVPARGFDGLDPHHAASERLPHRNRAPS